MRNDYWLIIAAMILIASLIMHQVILLLVCLLFLLTSGVSRLINRYCLHRIECRRYLSSNHVFFGEEITYEMSVANRKPLPLPWLRVDDELPAELNLLKGKASRIFENRIQLTNIFPISWYHRIKRRFPIQCRQRGCFAFGPARITSGDIFGFFQRDKTIEDQDYLMVYPRLVPLETLGIPSKQLFGDIRLKTHLFRDPVLTSGVRDYQFGDSMKRINWKSTARLGKLQTKTYEPTTTVDISIFLDVRTVRHPQWGVIPQLLELGIITAASLSQYALDSDYAVGLYVNQVIRFSEGMVRIPHSQHPDQLLHILEALAQLHETEAVPSERFIREEARRLPWGSTLVVITAQPSDHLLATLLELKRVGRSVVLIRIGGAPLRSDSNGIPIFHVTDDATWDLVDKVNLEAEN